MVWVASSTIPDENHPCLLHENHQYYGTVEGETPAVHPPKGWGVRHTLAVLGCLGFSVSFSLRVNISMAIVAMVNRTAVARLSASSSMPPSAGDNTTRDANTTGNTTWQPGPDLTEDGPFVWSGLTQGVILSAYFVGYTVSQVPGGRLAERAGAVRTLTAGIGITGLLTLLTPACALWRVEALIVVRALQGVTTPSVHCLLARWVPPLERSRISSFVYVGKQLGTAVTILAAGPLCSWQWAGGWQAVFYVTGGVSLVWCLTFIVVVHETPRDHPRISYRERLYIHAHARRDSNKGSTESFPWRQVLLSRPFQALVVVHFCQNWGDYLIMTDLPTYIGTTLHYPLSTNAMFSALPQLAKMVFAISVSFAADRLARGRLSLGVNRKLWNSVGMYIPAVTLIGVSFAGRHDAVVLTLMVLTVGFNGAVLSGYNVNHMELAPSLAGTLMGITNCVATLAGVLAPFQAGYIINQSPSLANWSTVFLTAAGLFAFGNTVFCVFGSSVQQPWGDPLVAIVGLEEEQRRLHEARRHSVL